MQVGIGIGHSAICRPSYYKISVNTFVTVEMVTALLLCGLTIAIIVLRWKYVKLKARENRTKTKVSGCGALHLHQCSDNTMVNATFTLWNRQLYLLYPP